MRWALKRNAVIRRHLHLQQPARHAHLQRGLAQTQAHAGRSRSATAAARCQRVAGAAFPNLNLNLVGIKHTHQLHIGALREERMALQQRTQAPYQRGRDARQRHHAMRIADANCSDVQQPASHLQRLIDNRARCTSHRNGAAVKTGAPELHLHGCATGQHPALHYCRRRCYCKWLAGHQPAIPQVARKNAQAVATGLSL